MSFFTKILSWFSGSKTATQVVEIVDEAVHTEQEKSEQDSKDTADARSMQIATHNTWFDVIIDGWSRAIRPGVTTWLIGGWAGWWAFPNPALVGPFWQEITLLVLTFWFGGRALLKDLPAAVSAIMASRKK